jgi:hypothetical protein
VSRTLQQVLLEQDPSGWRLLVGCVLLNVTTRTQVDAVHPELFRRWPTPEKMAGAREATIARVLEPLGCSARRAVTLKRMSHDFLEHESRAGEGVLLSYDVPHFYGLGEYARDSWAIFVEGRRDMEPTDRVLAAWLAGWHDACDALAEDL